MTNVLNWVKRNWIIVVLCTVMVIALPVFVFVSASMNSRVHSAINTRVQDKIGKINNVSKTAIEITPLVPGSQAFSDSTVINQTILNQYRSLREQIKADADTVVLKALSINIKAVPDGAAPNKDVLLQALGSRQSDVLIKGLLPEPSQALQYDLPFKVNAQYLSAHDQILRSMRAGTPPLVEDVARQLSDFDQSFRRAQLNKEPGEPLQPEEQTRLSEAMLQKRLSLYAQRGAEISVYADAAVFGLEEWKAQTPPAPIDYFDWQHAYWTHSDIAAAVTLANTSDDGAPATVVGPNHESSVVKRIIAIESPSFYNRRYKAKATGSAEAGGEGEMMVESFIEGGESAMPSGKGAAGPRGSRPGGGSSSTSTKVEAPKNDDPNQRFEPNFVTSLSGRGPNGLYDIRMVTMSVVVDSRRIGRLLEAIGQTNFMTVTSCALREVDIRDELSQGYFYNNEPVVIADLEIETAWLREWTVPLMPPIVKEAIGVTPGEDVEGASDEGSDEGGSESEMERGGGRGRSDG